MTRLYRNKRQQLSVIYGVEALMGVMKRLNCQISKETLNLICDRYCYLVDPPATADDEVKYKPESKLDNLPVD